MLSRNMVDRLESMMSVNGQTDSADDQSYESDDSGSSDDQANNLGRAKDHNNIPSSSSSFNDQDDAVTQRMNEMSTPFVDADEDIRLLGEFLTTGSCYGIACWIVLMVGVYMLSPAESFGVLEGPERSSALLVLILLVVTNGSRLVPMFLRNSSKLSRTGAMIGSCSVQGIAIISLFTMAFLPTPIMLDQVTGRRVSMVRWAEWTPLSFLMTFMTEAIDISFNSKSRAGVRVAWFHGICIALSTFAGMLFPLCTTLTSWLVCFAVSVILFCSIYIRLYQRWALFLVTPKGTSVDERERYDRVRLSLRLLQVCSFWWTGLVVGFTLCCFMPHLAPNTFWAHPGLPGIIECIFEIGSKIGYLSLILDVHDSLFDEGARAVRRLEEMRAMMSVVWESSSDVIVMAAPAGEDTVHAIVSPTFFQLNQETAGRPDVRKLVDSNAALVFEMSSLDFSPRLHRIFAMNMSDSQGTRGLQQSVDPILRGAEDSVDQRNVQSMVKLVAKAWNLQTKESLIMHSLFGLTQDGREQAVQCEAKITKLVNDTVVVVLRDISERFQRFEAEKQLVVEVTERKKDAEANRFTRHEVKNGLLAAIGLVDSLKEVVTNDPVPSSTPKRRMGKKGQQTDEGLGKVVSELDETLREVLDTILAEAMARDVVHEVYQPKREKLAIRNVLEKARGSSDAYAQRFPVETTPEPFPILAIDPQLLRFIHRNAVSNGIKYGKPGGVIKTEVYFDFIRSEFQMRVINLPGERHEELVAMGDDATNRVFSAQTRLRQHVETNERVVSRSSSGDGAWIMQKCAKIMGGSCSIKFEKDSTIFALLCPAEVHKAKFTVRVKKEKVEQTKFKLPEAVWGIAIDDSGIQRKLLGRFLSLAGIQTSKRKVHGQSAEEILGFSTFLVDLVRKNPNDKFLVIVDENLDIMEGGTHRQTVSGSICVKVVREQLVESEEARLLTLVRSANDSKDDVDKYLERAHGFLPKGPIQKDKVLEVIEPLWLQRFSGSDSSTASPSPDPKSITSKAPPEPKGVPEPPASPPTPPPAPPAFPPETLPPKSEPSSAPPVAFVPSPPATAPENVSPGGDGEDDDDDDDEFAVSAKDLIVTLDSIDSIIQKSNGDLQAHWQRVRDKLHVLKGDLLSMDPNTRVTTVLEAVSKLQGGGVPDQFQERWDLIRNLVTSML